MVATHRRIMKYVILICLIFILVPVPSWATTRNVTCSGTITSALNSAISASSNGDIVQISAGSCSMGALNMMTNKNITIQGAGKDSTVITANSGWGQIEYTSSNSPQFRLSGFTLTSTSTPGTIITVWADQSASWRGPFIIDNIKLNYPNNGPDGAIGIFGPVYGLIYSCDFIQSYEAHILTGLGVSSESGAIGSLTGSYGASLAYQPGASNYLYIEDCTFTGTSSAGAAVMDTGYTGGRWVFRHNTVTRGTIYAHWTSGGSWNSLWLEVYNNKFIWDGDSGYQVMRLQGGGTGLIYNNTMTGFTSNNITIGEDRLTRGDAPLNMCSGSNSWDGNTDSSASGWPCLSQTGRDAGKTMTQIQAGSKQASFPLYLWNNGQQDKCYNTSASGSACDNSFGVDALQAAYFKTTAHSTTGFGNGDKDYCIETSQPAGCGTHTLTYTPYTYPHPLRGETAAVIPSSFSGTTAQGVTIR
jgi:hypothetical protein